MEVSRGVHPAVLFPWPRNTLTFAIAITENHVIAVRTSSGPSGPSARYPPHIAQYLLEIVSQRGVLHLFCLVSSGIAQVLLRYPFGGYCTSTSHAQKRGRGYRTQLVMMRHQKPHSAQYEGIAEIVGIVQYGATKVPACAFTSLPKQQQQQQQPPRSPSPFPGLAYVFTILWG